MQPSATNPFSLEGKLALVTGGSRGIGYAIAAAFIDAGAHVVISARGEEALNEAAVRLGPHAIARRCDIGDPYEVSALVADAWRLAPIDVLVNNAGISPYYKRAEQVTAEEFDEVTGVNLRGNYLCAVEVAKRMFEAGRPGSIINVASVLGIQPEERLGVYSMTKAGLIGLTKALALEWADRHVRVNAIAPGWTESDMTGPLFASRHGERLRESVPAGRFATAEEMTGAALYLASDASSYVTGSVIRVDGGRLLR